MAIGVKFKRTRIADYMDTHFSDEIFEVIEDSLAESEPAIKLLTKNREVSLSCDESGQVQEEFKIADGANAEEFSLKKQAYIALNTFLGINYPEAIIIKDSFENSIIKLEADNKNVALSYDFENKTVIRKERAKRGTALSKNDDIEGQMSLFDIGLEVEPTASEVTNKEEATGGDSKYNEETVVSKVAEKKEKVNQEAPEEVVAEVSEETIEETTTIVTKSRKPRKKDVLPKTSDEVPEEAKEPAKEEKKVEFIVPKNDVSKTYSEMFEGTIVKSIYSDKKYTVLRDRGSTLKVRDKDGNSFEVPRSDTVIYVEETEASE